MTDTLFHAYLPLVAWSGLGLLLFRFLPQSLPRLLGRGLYWVGIPIEIFALARQTDFSENVGLAPFVTVAALILGFGLAWLSLQGLKFLPQRSLDPEREALSAFDWSKRSRQGSFVLASMIGNTGFVGLAIAPALVSDRALSWVVFYSVTHNVVGTYGLGVLVASYFGRPDQQNHWWIQLRDVLTVPSLWAFILGSLTRSLELPEVVESGFKASVWIVIPSALLLMGMRLSQLQGWKSLQSAIAPAILKVIVIPVLVGLATAFLGLSADLQLALVLMSGMPSAFAGLILAEEYDLDRELIASSIALTSVMLLLAIPLWLVLFSGEVGAL